MGRLINHEKAKAFLDHLDDPIIQALIEDAYAKIFTEHIGEFQGEFDLLFFYKVLAAFMRDREGLAKALQGQLEQHPIIAD
jgi:hypothetical protein